FVLFGMRRMEVVESNAEGFQVQLLLLRNPLDQLLGRYAFLARLDHDRRTVRVTRTHVGALVAAQFLEARPDVGIDVFHHVAQVYRPVCIGEGAADEDSSCWGWHRWDCGEAKWLKAAIMPRGASVVWRRIGQFRVRTIHERRTAVVGQRLVRWEGCSGTP